MRYDAEHKERTRARVLTEAARSLRADGPHKLSVAEVMGRAGLTHGGFYAYFRSKDELLAAATEAAFGDGRCMLDAAVEGREPRAALTAYIGDYLSMRHLDSPDRGCPLPAMAGDVRRMGDDVRERLAAGIRRLTAQVLKLLEAAEVGDAAALSSSVVAELVGAVALARALPDAGEAARLLDASRAALSERLGLEAAS